MIEKLMKNYNINQKLGNGGYAVGFWKETKELLLKRYDFPKGDFIIMDEKENFVTWYYQPKK
ncbi:MAG: hypothetical protein ABIC91_07895 [Nanoarchaeota archaeon]|nr:hypothetical protein [Nanoarchaeota archaeon]